MHITAGVDLASEEHRLVVVDASGHARAPRRYRHSEDALLALIQHLLARGVARVAIEQPNGLVVDRLLDAGIGVVPVHPNQLAAARDRYRSSGGKSDGFDSPIALAFLERYPSPADARNLGERRLAGFLARNSYCGRKTPAALLQRLRSAPHGRADEAELEARRAVVLALVTALTPLVEQIKLLTNQIAGAIHTHHDGQIFLSLSRDPKSVVTAAELLAEIGDNRARYRSSSALEAIAGQAPITMQSGKSTVARFRRACNKTLRDAVSVLADSSRKHNPWAADIYQRARARGHDHPHAIRILGRARLRIIWRLWHDKTAYDPLRHRSRNRPRTATG